MKHTLLTIILVFLAPQAFGKELQIGYFVTPPHVIDSDEESRPTGLVIDLWHVIAAQLGHEITWKRMPLARLIKSVETGSLDAGTLLVPTPPRKEILHFSDTPWDIVQPGIIVRIESTLNSLNSAADLAGLSIGYNNKGVVTPWFKENEIRFTYIFGTNPLSRLINLLEAKRLDAVYWPVISAAKYQASLNEIDDKLKFIRSPKGPFPIHPFFPKSTKGVALALELDQVLPKAKATYNFDKQKRILINKQ